VKVGTVLKRKPMREYDWQQSLTDDVWVLRIDDTHSFEVAFYGYDDLDEEGQGEIFSYTVTDFLGRRGTVKYDCCCDCAKWKCIGYLERNEWRLLAPNKENT